MTAATLVLGGCGGGGGAPVPPASEVFSDFCMTFASCEPTDFSYYFSSVADCISEMGSYADYYTAVYGTACGEGFVEYYDCLNQNVYGPACSYDYSEVLDCYEPWAADCGW